MGDEDFDEVIKILCMMARSVQKKGFYIVKAFIFRRFYLLIPSLSTAVPSSLQKNSLSPILSGEGAVRWLVINNS